MKNFLISISVLFFFLVPDLPGQKIREYNRISRSNPIFTPIDNVIQSLINQVNLDSLTQYVNVLSGEVSVSINGNTYLIQSRYSNHPHNDIAADYIEKKLNDTGLPTYNQIFSATGRNVYSVKDGTDYPNQKFIICAHYDDEPSSPPAPGADDNASGTAAVLEAARILSQVQTPYTVIFALWDEEETGYNGSEYFAEEAAINGENILSVVNLDMLGYDSNDDGLSDIHTRPIQNSVELAFLIENLNYNYQIGLLPVIYNPGTSRSDHGSFWDNNYSAITLGEAYYGDDFNPHWHSQNDKIIHFNLDYFHTVTKLALATIAHLSFYELNDIPLSVALTSFTARSDGEQIMLNWITESELNNDVFILERSEDNISFVQIAEIQGQGNSSHRTEYSYTDNYVKSDQIYYYRLSDRDYGGKITYHQTISIIFERKPLRFVFYQNYPNPFNTETAIEFSIPKSDFITLKIYNTLGEDIATLVSEKLEAGKYKYDWDAGGLASGVYLYRIQAGNYIIAKKMVLMK